MKKYKILIWSPNPTDGTSFYRAWGVYSRLSNVELVPFVGQREWQDLIGIDAVLVQRPYDQSAIEYMDIFKTNKIPIIVDYDDDMFNVPKDNPVYEHYNREEIRASVKEAYRLADIITVSTKALRDGIMENVPDAAPIVIVPNAVD